jgi:hypothetical protein
MPLCTSVVAEPLSLTLGTRGLVEASMSMYTQWNPAYEGASVEVICRAVDALLMTDTPLTPEQVNCRIEGMRATLYRLRTNLEINGVAYSPTDFTASP